MVECRLVGRVLGRWWSVGQRANDGDGWLERVSDGEDGDDGDDGGV